MYMIPILLDTSPMHVGEVSMLLKYLYPIKLQETNKYVI